MNENNFEKTSSENKEITVTEAVAFIENIRNQIAVMGANDSEMDDLNQIRSAMESEKISPQEAMNKALEIKNSKQDYH